MRNICSAIDEKSTKEQHAGKRCHASTCNSAKTIRVTKNRDGWKRKKKKERGREEEGKKKKKKKKKKENRNDNNGDDARRRYSKRGK